MLKFACIVPVLSFALCMETSVKSPNKAVDKHDLYEKIENLQTEMLKMNQRLAATEKEYSICQRQISALENTVNQVVNAKDTSRKGTKLVNDIPGDLSLNTQKDPHKRLLLSSDTTNKIAFSVALNISTPIRYHQSIKYDIILTNIGNGYNKSGGNFVAPYKGLYLLSATICNLEGYKQRIEIVRNGIQIAAFYVDPDDWDMSSQTIVVLLEQNDRVWLRKYGDQNSDLLYGEPRASLNTFSGVLLFEM